ncbi:hypothetical protein CPC16_004175 [Podila verticillata]|nr:hypothetical protein CPC16_004175 [Podila verticillata]KAI9234658.1 MAG: hypothetical protein BYD32DRAFT_423005 [Podila humilis]
MDQAERIDFSKATIATTDNSHICTKPAGTEEHVSTIDPALLPPNWPTHVKYLTDYEYHPSIAADTLALVQGRRRRKSEHHLQVQAPKVDDTEEEETRTEQEQEYDDIPLGHAIPGLLASSSSNTPPPLPPQYEIRLISSPPTHPVLGSYGLFALTTLRPGTHLLDYISLVAPDAAADPDSDHTLYLHSDLNLDASLQGNHGRFVNDFRGIRTQAQGPNVAWDLYRDAHSGQVRMGCKVLKRIAPGEEILCTYGKAYWKSRGVAAPGPEWEDGWDTDLEDSGSEEE